MADVDGRLDLDELGRVIEQASGLDTSPAAAPTDLDLLEGAEGPGLSERIGTWRVSAWMRRHRVLVASLATVAVAVCAVVWTMQSRRPPDDDGRLHLAVVDFATDRGNGFDVSDPTGTVVSATYSITPDRGGDTDSLVSVTGPGIRASSASVQDASAIGDRPRWTVSAILGCDDPSASTASVGQYRLVARRTDGFGRTVQESVRLPIGTEQAWDQQVRLACLQTQVQTRLSLDSATATLAPDYQSMVMRLRVRSTLDHDIVMTPSGSPGESVRAHGVARTISPGSASDLVVPVTFEDCAAPNMQAVPVSPPGAPDPVYVSERGVTFDVTDPSDPPQYASYASWSAVWSDQLAATVHHLIETACRGVPDATVHTASSADRPRCRRAVRTRELRRPERHRAQRALRRRHDIPHRADHRRRLQRGHRDGQRARDLDLRGIAAGVRGDRARRSRMAATHWSTSCGARPATRAPPRRCCSCT